MIFFRRRQLIGVLCLGLWFLLACSVAALAQEKPSSEKRALIKELLQLTDAGALAQNISDSMLTQLESTIPNLLVQAVGIDAVAAEPNQQVKELQQKFLQRFREELPKRIDFAQMLEQLSVPIYDRLFTESELKDLINFYRTPTGQKAIKAMPKIFQEMLPEAERLMTPPITALFTDLIEEMKKEASPTKSGQAGSTTKKKP